MTRVRRSDRGGRTAGTLALRADVIVVGSGPGGATVARDLARRGRRVLLLERGRDHRPRSYYGTYLGALLYCDRGGLLFTEEGLNIVRPLMLGGATAMYCGCAAGPPTWLKDRYGIDIAAEVAQAAAELEIAPLPPELRGAASTRIAEAARGLGCAFEPQPKFMRPARARDQRGLCGARCMLGCRCGAKWSAAEYADEAVEAGAELRTGARVDRVLHSGGRVDGVEGRIGRRRFRAEAQAVVVAAGGIGSPRLLQSSGFAEAGQGMAMDTTVMVYGFVRETGTGADPPMTWSWAHPQGGYMLSTLIDPWLMYPIITARAAPRHALTWPRWRNALGVMIKLTDEISGGVFPDGRISKPMTPRDHERQQDAQQLCRRILVAAGADAGRIFMTPLRGTHPSATARIGHTVDERLETATRGLFVCDASVFAQALGRPTVLTIIGLAKRLAAHLAR